MTTMRTGVTSGWGASGDRHVLLLPTNYTPNLRPLIVWCGPYLSGATSVLATGLADVWVRWGFPVLSLDCGQSRAGGVEGAASEWGGSGPEQWTDDTAMGALDTAWDTIARHASVLAQSGSGVGKMLLAGGSAGGAKVMQYARLNPDRVDKVLTFIGAVDLLAVQQSRPNVISGIGASITAKLGDPVPDNRNPAKAGDDWTGDHPAVRMHISSGDTVCLPSETYALEADINDAGGSAEVVVQNAGNHDFYTGLVANVDEYAHWLIA